MSMWFVIKMNMNRIIKNIKVYPEKFVLAKVIDGFQKIWISVGYFDPF